MTGGIILSILIAGKNPEILHQLGVGRASVIRHRISASEFEFKGQSRTAKFTNALKFPINYLMGEVAAFNLRSWGI
jgi:hypothetical protein